MFFTVTVGRAIVTQERVLEPVSVKAFLDNVASGSHAATLEGTEGPPGARVQPRRLNGASVPPEAGNRRPGRQVPG